MSNPLRKIDLNLLPVLDALLSTASVSAAAEQLGLSQPATSQALARLRDLLQDPLLVRSGRAMRLSMRAMELRPLVAAACRDLLGLLSPEDFDPATLRRTFTIATPDYCALLITRLLMPILRERAPGIDVRFIDASAATPSQLAGGDLDIAVTARMPQFEQLSLRTGFYEHYTCLVASGHALATHQSVTLAEIGGFERIGVNHAFDSLAFGSVTPPAPWFQIAPSHLLVLPLLVEDLGVLSVTTTALARIAKELTAAIAIQIEDAPPPLEVCLAWNPVLDADKPHQWFRSVLDGVIRAVFEERADT